MKRIAINKENLSFFQKTWKISVKFPWKMCLMIILKVKIKPGINLSLDNAVLEKPQGGQIDAQLF